MTNWTKVIEDNWENIVDVMSDAARKAGELDNETRLFVELNEDGKVETYVNFDGIMSAEVMDGTAIVLKKFYGGEYWDEDWAYIYDPTPDLEALIHEIHNMENA